MSFVKSTISERELDKTPLTFGKHCFKTPEAISNEDPNYIIWLYENVKPKACSKELYESCLEEDEDDSETLREAYDN